MEDSNIIYRVIVCDALTALTDRGSSTWHPLLNEGPVVGTTFNDSALDAGHLDGTPGSDDKRHRLRRNLPSTNLSAALRELAPHLKPLAGPVFAFAGSASFGTLKFVAAVAISGFLFHYGPQLVAAIRGIQARLVTQRSQDFVALAGLTIRTVAQGVIGVAVLQSLLAGIGLKLAGVPHAGVLAFAVLILAILQIGSAVVLVPVIIWIWATKDFALALPLTIYLLIVGFADNVLKPMLMGRGLNTPMLVIFIGVLGGMLAHGILGLFVGPIILAVTWELIMAWIREERAESASFDVEPSHKGSQAKPGVQPQHSIGGLPPPPPARSDS